MNEELIKKAKSGDADAMYEVAVIIMRRAMSNKDESLIPEAIKWMEKAASHGNTNAQCEIASWHMKNGNNEQSLYWLKKAAENGHTDAINTLKDAEYTANASVAPKKTSDDGLNTLGTITTIAILIAAGYFIGVVSVIILILALVGWIFFLGRYESSIQDKIKDGLQGAMIIMGLALGVFFNVTKSILITIHRMLSK